MLFCDSCGAVQHEQASYCFACGNSLQEPLLRGRYRIIGPVGQGGFGAVYEAQDTLCEDRLVAIKDINLHNLKPQEIIDATDAFNREVSLLSDLSHPNLPRMYDHFTDSQHWYLVIDFIRGETLEQYLEAIHSRMEGLPLREVLDIGIQLCTVLDYLHTHKPPIIFRDLKPANVMRTSNGHLYLIDFGIARLFKPGQSRDTMPLGSPGYAAPEQYGRAQTTPQADIYSLGAMLHQLLTGDDPAQTPFRFLSLEQQNQPAIEQLQALLSQMLEMNVNARPSSVSLIKQTLEQIACELQPAILQPVGTLYTTYRGHTRLVLAVAWSPDGKYIASGSFDGTLQVWRPAQVDGTTTIETSDFTYRNPGKPHAWTWALAWSPDGRYLASGSDDKTIQVWSLADEATVSMKHVLTYHGHTSWVNTVAWSPDGKYIASGSDDKTVQVWCVEEADQPEVVQVYRGHSRWVNSVAWSPDGKSIASAGYDTMVRIWDVATQETVLIYRGHGYRVNALAWSPDGTRIASCSLDNLVRVWDVATGKTVLTYRGHASAVSALAWSPDGTRIASGGKDKTVQVWHAVGSDRGDFGSDHRASRGRTIYTYRGHSGWVLAVAWKPTPPSGMPGDGLIASGGNDKIVQVWQAV